MQGLGGRAHGRDGLRVGRQLQRAGDRAGPIHQCSGCPGDSSWPLCFPTDVATSGPALLCSLPDCPTLSPLCPPGLGHPSVEGKVCGSPTTCCGSQGQSWSSELSSKALQGDTWVMSSDAGQFSAVGTHGSSWG